MKISYFMILFCLAIVILPSSLYSYVDLGTASYMVQIVIGAVMAGLFSLKLFWGKIAEIISNLFR